MLMTARPCPAGWLSQAAIVSFMVVACQAGTGGEQTEKFYRARGERGYAIARYNGLPDTDTNGQERSAAENVAHIRNVLKSSVTELAATFGVSRQAIYDWQSGKTVSQENLDRLNDFAKAADLVSGDALLQSPRAFRRKIAGGKTVFEIVRDGGSAQEAVRSLMAMLHREAEQRNAMQTRFAGRQVSKVQPSDLGIPMLREG